MKFPFLSPVQGENVQLNRRGHKRQAQDMEKMFIIEMALHVLYETVLQPNRRGHKCRAQDMALHSK
jgi:hypothetical protein